MGQYGPITFVLILGMALYAVNQFVVATIMPSVTAELGDVDFYTWSFSLFAVGAIAGSASAGPFSQAIGMRRAYAGAGLLLAIGLAGAALAGDMASLVTWRLVQGVGGGAVASQGYGLIATTYPPHLRGRALGLVSSIWGISTVTGPGYGALFAEFGIWRGAFWSLLAMALVFALISWRYISGERGHGQFSQVPYARLALLCVAVLFMSATSLTAQPEVQVPLVIASIATAAYALYLDGRAGNRIFLRGTALPSSAIGAVCWILFLVTVVLAATNTFTTFYLQALHGVSPLTAGYLFAAQSIMWTTSALIVASARPGSETRLIIAGTLIILIATAATALFADSGPVVVIAVAVGVSGIGLGTLNNPVIQRIMAAAPEDEKHAAGTSVQTIRNLGISFGAAVSGMVAVGAGLNDTASRGVTASAMEWVFGVATLFAAAGLALALSHVVRSNR